MTPETERPGLIVSFATQPILTRGPKTLFEGSARSAIMDGEKKSDSRQLQMALAPSK